MTEIAYDVTLYRDDPDEASAHTDSGGWWAKRERAEAIACQEIISRNRSAPAGSHWSATIEEGWIEEYVTEDGIKLRNFECSPDGHQWAIGLGDDGWWQDQYR